MALMVPRGSRLRREQNIPIPHNHLRNHLRSYLRTHSRLRNRLRHLHHHSFQ